MSYTKPTKYYVEFEDKVLVEREIKRILKRNPGMVRDDAFCHLDPARTVEYKEFDEKDLYDAAAFAKKSNGTLYERIHVRKENDIWDWDIKEITY